VVLEVLHDKNGTHHTLIITVHDTTQGSEQTSQEDIRVLQHTHDTMGLLRVGTAND
jgi:hypothetical protein